VSLSRRDALKCGIGAMVIGSTINGASGLTTSSVSCDPLLLCTKNVRWRNKHGNVSTDVESLYQPWNRTPECSRLAPGTEWRAGLTSIRAILSNAEQQKKQVRAVGGTWSLSEVATCSDFMIDTTALNYHAPIDPEHVLPESPIDAAHLYFAQCGTSVVELNVTLQARGLCLCTSGASQGQTICGAFSTGTHGSAIDRGSMQDYIVGIHLLVDGGAGYWLERASTPVVTDSFCLKLGATRLSDDQLFDAALVSFGSFGFIHAVLLEVEPIYSLRVRRMFLDWQDIREVARTLDFSNTNSLFGAERPFHFEIDLDPYGTRKGARGASLLVMHRIAYEAVKPDPDIDAEYGVDLLTLIGQISQSVPLATPIIASQTFHASLTPKESYNAGPRGTVFGATAIKGKSMSCEIGVDLSDAATATELLVCVANRYPFAGAFALRYVRASRAPLAFTKFAPVTCTIEIPAAGSQRTLEYYRKAFAALDEARLPYTLHWGQINNFNDSNVRAMWSEGIDNWLTARHRILTSVNARWMFTNRFLNQCGLDI
jgi:hypothetical protein